MVSKERKAEIVKEFGKDANDTGNTAVQIALVTEDIKMLTQHLLANKHDYTAKRALTINVAKRNSLLAYLKRTDDAKYVEVKSKLGLK